MNNIINDAGLLESVSNLTVTSINSTTVLISWSPPFTLEGVPILGYNVTICNPSIKSEKNETMYIESTAVYLYNYYSFDDNFTVIVVPINKGGAGEPKIKTFSLNGFISQYMCMSVPIIKCLHSL